MAKFKPKPIEIEAKEFRGDASTGSAIVEWVNAGWTDNDGPEPPALWYYGELRIRIREEVTVVKRWEWVVKGEAGEFYILQPSTFESMFEMVL